MRVQREGYKYAHIQTKSRNHSFINAYDFCSLLKLMTLRIYAAFGVSQTPIIIYQGKEEGTMKELEKKMQNESFDVEVQYCNPDDCLHDCETAPNHCTVHFTSLW